MCHSPDEVGQLVFFKKKKKILPFQEDSSCKVKKQRAELGIRLFPVLLEGLGLSRLRPPVSEGAQAGGDSLKPVLRSPAFSSPSPSSGRRPGSLPSVRRSLLWHRDPRCPARRRSRAAAASPAPRTGPPGVWAPALRLRSPQPPRPAALPPLCARGANPATRERSAARGAEGRAPGSGAGSGISARSEPALQPRVHGRPAPWLPMDPAPAPGSGRRRCFSLACRASPCRRMVSVRGVSTRRRAPGGSQGLGGETKLA